MNPAALKTNLDDLPKDGTVFVNEDAFSAANLKLAKYAENPLEDTTLDGYRVFKVPMSSMTVTAVAELGLGRKQAERCKNFFALGMLYFLYERPVDSTIEWIQSKFAKAPELAKANVLAMKAGHNFADTLEAFQEVYRVERAELPAGTYRSVNGNLATAYGLAVAAHKAGNQLFYGSYPITPASDILHELSRMRAYNVKTFQAEDEIAAMGATIGAAYTGAVSVTGTSGPGVALKGEALGLAVMTELPMVIVNVQRGGPSTGLPTKTEQADLFQAIFGRNGECPMPVLAARSPADCFDVAIEAVRTSIRYMTPVMMLTDGYVANGAEPWRIPDLDSIDPIEVKFLQPEDLGEEGYLAYKRDPVTMGRQWAIPGTPELMHRVGGLEKDHLTGDVCYVPENHFEMVKTRAEKVERIAQDYPALEVDGPEEGPLLILGWGSTHGSIVSAADKMRAEGLPVANLNLRHLNPLPRDLGEVLERYENILVPELNMGQLAFILRARYLRAVHSLPKVMGQPFKLDEIITRAGELLGSVKTA
jgi:2-oxoglutarate ferredoxin oxidoreductase subunit alpha